jgi:hypothetical protein
MQKFVKLVSECYIKKAFKALEMGRIDRNGGQDKTLERRHINQMMDYRSMRW